MTISFLYPLFLAALSFLIIPVIIHFLQKNKITKLQFSTTLFFKESTLKKSKFKRLNKILQLLIRILIITTLVLLFSSPFKSNNSFNKLSSQNTKIYCWFDRSLSMDYKKENISLLESGKSLLNFIDTTLPGELLIFNNNKFTPYQKKQTGNSLKTDSKFKNFINEVNNLPPNESNIILILSDFQKNNTSLYDFIKNRDSLTIALDLHPNKINNISLDTISIIQTQKKKLFVSVSSKGNIKTSLLELLSNNMRRGFEDITLNDSIQNNVCFNLSDDIKWGEIKITTKDDFVWDNNIYFCENKEMLKKILLITEKSDFSNLSEALSTVINKNEYQLIHKTPNTVDAENINEAELIILNELSNASSTIYSLLKPGYFKNKKILYSPTLEKDGKFLNIEVFRFLNPNFTFNIADSLNIIPSKKLSPSHLWQDFNQKDLNDVIINRALNNLPGIPILKSLKNQSLISKIIDSNESIWITSAFELDQSNSSNIPISGFYIPLIDILIKELNLKDDISSTGYIAGRTFAPPIEIPGNEFEIIGLTDPAFKQNYSSPFINLNDAGVYKIKNRKLESYQFPVNYNKDELELEYFSLNEITEKKTLKILNDKNFKEFITSIKHGNFEFQLILILLILLLSDISITIYLSLKSELKNSTI